MAEQDILSKIGVGSGLDTTALIQALVDADSAPQKESLDRDEENTEAKISALGMLKSNLQSFNNILENIKSSDSTGFKGFSSSTTKATLTADGSEAAATIDSSLTITNLASSHTLTGPSYSALSNTVGSGSLTIAFGTWSADPTSGGGQTHTANSQDSITVNTTSTTTLTQLRDLINNAAGDSDNDGKQDVLASVIYDGTNYMLMLKSESGASNEMKVTATSNLANTVNNVSYNYNATTSNMNQRVAGTNSAFSVDGISMTRESNSISDLFDGFTLDLFATSSDTVTLRSSVDLDNITDLLSSYVSTYNEILGSLDELSSNPNNLDNDDVPEAGALNGNSLIMSIKTQLRSLSSMAIKGYEGGPYYLANMGIKTLRDGSLSLDRDALKKQFSFDPDSIHAFFRNQLKTDNSNISVTNYNFLNTKPGSYAFSTDGSTHTIGGESATKNGTQYSVSSGDPNGLVVNVASGVTSGNIYYGKSFLQLTTDTIETYIKFNSSIDTQVQSNRDRLRELADKRIRLEERIEKLTQRYAIQYSNMESAVAGLNETGNMLNAMLETDKD